MENTKFKTLEKKQIPERVQTKIDEYKRAKEEARAKRAKN